MLLLLASFLLLSGSDSSSPPTSAAGSSASPVSDSEHSALPNSDAGSSASPVHAAEDLDGDGKPEEYCMSGGALTVSEEGQLLWSSLEDWAVDSFVLGDADNDGGINLVISLWKQGSFGEVRPFWHEEEDHSYKNHLFVYRLQENELKPVWCSSNLDRPILSFTIWDSDGDGRNELVTEEGEYRKAAEERFTADPDGNVRTTVWRWEEWGFRLLEQ